MESGFVTFEVGKKEKYLKYSLKWQYLCMWPSNIISIYQSYRPFFFFLKFSVNKWLCMHNKCTVNNTNKEKTESLSTIICMTALVWPNVHSVVFAFSDPCRITMESHSQGRLLCCLAEMGASPATLTQVLHLLFMVCNFWFIMMKMTSV